MMPIIHAKILFTLSRFFPNIPNIAAILAYMRDFRKQRIQANATLGFFGLCAGLLLLLFLVVMSAQAAWNMYVKFTVASRADDAAQKELTDLTLQHEKIGAAVEGLSSARGEEGQIRERFGVVKPGEGAIQIVRNGTSTASLEGSDAGNPIWRILRSLFIW